jgi:hypothetical protein
MAMAAATEARPAQAGRSTRKRFGPDRLTVALLTVTAFLFVLAMLATQLQAAPAPARHRVVLIRRIYETRVVQTIQGHGGAGATGGNSVTQSVSSSGATAAPAPTTRASG